MTARELALWLREEHGKLAELAASLLKKTAVVPRARQQQWIDDARGAFDHFRAHMARHMSLEEHEGYMLPAVELRPALSREVERLAHEHGEIRRMLDRIHEDLGTLAPDDALLIRDGCRRIQNLLQYIEHHEKDENLLVMSAYGEDLGTED
jgi:hemerythrin-like domain-containing protein